MEEALRRALAIQAMPQNLPRTLRLGWHSADLMWRLAGDTATDYNHYTKRALLAGIYTATLAVFVDDQSEGKAETRAFLDRRIEGVMQFEKAKAQLLQHREGLRRGPLPRPAALPGASARACGTSSPAGGVTPHLARRDGALLAARGLAQRHPLRRGADREPPPPRRSRRVPSPFREEA